MRNVLRLILFSLIMLTTWACGGDKVITKDQMVDIMSDMYTADALDERQSVKVIYDTSRDSVAVYTPILKKYGYTPDDFIASIKYYTEKPVELKDIYSGVVAKLDQLERKYAKEYETEKKERNCWLGADTIIIDTDSVYNSIDFDIELRGLGTYQIEAKYKFGDSDSIPKPCLTAWFTSADHPDSTFSKRSLIINKSHQNIQSFQINLSDTSYIRLKGQLLGVDTVIDTLWRQQVNVTDIYINYIGQDDNNAQLLLEK